MAAKPTPLPGDSTKLEVIKSVKANYPVAAEGKQIQGQVLLKVSVTDTGDVEQVDVVRGDPILAKAAVEAAKKWKFKPFIKNGKAIPVVTQLPFDFAFSDRVTDEKPPKSDDRASGANANSADTLKKIRVSGGVIEGNIIHKVVPVYPQEAKQKLIQGTVLLHAIIDKEGRVAELTPISGPKELIPASIGAVQQWRYRPYVLMGEPIEVETTITVNFNLR